MPILQADEPVLRREDPEVPACWAKSQMTKDRALRHATRRNRRWVLSPTKDRSRVDRWMRDLPMVPEWQVCPLRRQSPPRRVSPLRPAAPSTRSEPPSPSSWPARPHFGPERMARQAPGQPDRSAAPCGWSPRDRSLWTCRSTLRRRRHASCHRGRVCTRSSDHLWRRDRRRPCGPVRADALRDHDP